MLREVPPFVFCVAQQVRCSFFAIAAFQEFVIDLEPDEGSALAILAHSNNHTHAFDSTTVLMLTVPLVEFVNHGSTDLARFPDGIRKPL